MKKAFVIAIAALVSIAAMAQPKFAHVNFSELVQLMPEADQARATIQASSQEAMGEEFNSKYQAYQQKVSTWTPAIRETKEKELTEIQQRIQSFEQTVQQELAQQQQSLMAPIQKKAMDTVEELAKKEGFVYVFDLSQVLYIDEKQSVDLTPLARKALGIKEGRTLETLQQEMAAQQQQ